MKKLLNLLFIATILPGCAGVKLYNDGNFKSRTGLKFYYPKPYLLVEKNGAKDVPLKTTILYLPDLANPVFAKVISGMGSNAFSIALANGSLSTYGVTTDTKIPESITAAGGLLTGLGGLLTGTAALKTAGKDVQQAGTVKDLQEVLAIIDQVKIELVDNAVKQFPDFITANQKASLEAAKTEIINTQKLIAPLNIHAISEIAASIDKVVTGLKEHICSQETEQCKNYSAKYLKLIDQLAKSKEKLQPQDNANAPSFELYEITTGTNGIITYRLVKSEIK